MNAPKKPDYTWQGKGLRLIDLLSIEERKSVLSMFPSEAQFRAQHVKTDATAVVKHLRDNNDIGDDFMNRNVWEQTLIRMGHRVVRAMDGRLDVIDTRVGSVPLRGTIAPGSQTEAEIAKNYVRNLEAQGKHPEFPVYKEATRPLIVSKDFAEYLRANGEPVKAIERDAQGDAIFIWPALHDEQVDRFVRSFQLASLGANEPDGGQLARVVEAKAPKQYAMWANGFADQWRMMDSLRENLLRVATEMTSGNFADKNAGGPLSEGLRSFQRAYQALAEDALQGKPSPKAVEELNGVMDQVMKAADYLNTRAPIPEADVYRGIINSVDLAATVTHDLVEHQQKYEREQSRGQQRDLGPASGLG